MAAATERIHATAIALGGRAVLLRGLPGSGKSDLALRCLSANGCALIGDEVRLVSDDQVVLERQGDRLSASAPATIRDKLEVRGVGIVTFPALAAATVCLVAELGAPVERLPEPQRHSQLLGLQIPTLSFAPFEPSAHLKVLLALKQCVSSENNLR